MKQNRNNFAPCSFISHYFDISKKKKKDHLELDFLAQMWVTTGHSPALQGHIAAQDPAVLQLDAFRRILQVSRQAGCGWWTRAPLIGQRAAAQGGDGRMLFVWGRGWWERRRSLLSGQMVT